MLMKYRGSSYQLNSSPLPTIDTGVSAHYRSLEFSTTKLKYRGASYQVEPHYIEIVDSGVSAKYRGAVYQIQRTQPLNLIPIQVKNAITS